MSDVQLQEQLQWDKGALSKFNLMIEKIPLFHRKIAQQVVHKKAALNARDRDSLIVEESDIVRAFFSEVPFAFYSLMVRLLDEVGFNYKEHEPR